ncbi:MAG: agmatine deiminase family protein [Gammaproteobacteria bacterium]
MKTKSTYRMPAEWEAQSAVMLTWPHGYGDWAPWLAHVEPVFVEIARQVTLTESLLVSCHDAEQETHVRTLLQQNGVSAEAVATYVVPSNDSWVRDHGPITVLHNGTARLLDFTFNGWGGKFDSTLDDRITRQLHAQGAFGTTSLETVDLVLEGGSIEVDGAGTLLTTTHCLLSPKRNPQLDRGQLEVNLSRWLGIDRVLWLEHGHLAGDDTDSHIDTLARFCNTETIVYVACDDVNDAHYADLRAMEAELKEFRTVHGKPYQLIPLPWPQAKYNATGQRLPASYANFLIINATVLVPTYEDRADEAALACLQQCFPQHRVIGIPCLPLIMQYGSLHCVTMQLPLVTL